MDLKLFLLPHLLLSALALPGGSRIFGGEIAEPGQFPYIVALNNPNQFCDGAIIDDTWVLTSALCAQTVDDKAYVLAGTVKESEGGITFNITKVITHEEYDTETSKNDIGLLQIDGSFQFDDNVQPIEIADPEVNATCQVAGWGGTEEVGYPDELRFVEVRALSLDECKEAIADMDPFYLGEEQICAGGEEGKGACFGDSGGPLACGNQLAGIISYTVSACAHGYPDVYTRASAYVDWIAENTK